MNANFNTFDDVLPGIERAARTLPADRDAMLEIAAQAAAVINAGIIAGDMDSVIAAYDRYEAVAWVLNGRTIFATACSPDGGQYLVHEHCRSPDGTTPLWFQPGRFCITVQGIRCVVEASSSRRLAAHYGLHAVDWDRPFVSSTGYLSVFDGPRPGLTVRQAAEEVFEAELAERKRCPIDRAWFQPLVDLPWLDTAVATQAMSFIESSGQAAFGF